jgi:hypothetical protein
MLAMGPVWHLVWRAIALRECSVDLSRGSSRLCCASVGVLARVRGTRFWAEPGQCISREMDVPTHDLVA